MEIITLENQSLAKIKGTKKVSNCTPTSAIILLDKNILTLQGENLEIKKLDLENQEVILSGRIISMKFSNEKEKQSLMKRIFK